jgi:hypothetical protein
MARADFDMSELESWGDDLRAAGPIAHVKGRAVVSKGSLNIKNEARKNAPGSGAAKHYPASINYDITETPVMIEGEIGPAEGRRQWGLGNLFEYGSENNPPMPHLEPALDHEEPKFYAAAALLAEEAIPHGGLRR